MRVTFGLVMLGIVAGCGPSSPYPWDGFGYGVEPDGCTAQVGFTAGEEAPQELEIVCANGSCECFADGESVASFRDAELCSDWSDAMSGGPGRQDRMVAYAVEQCGL